MSVVAETGIWRRDLGVMQSVVEERYTESEGGLGALRRDARETA